MSFVLFSFAFLLNPPLLQAQEDVTTPFKGDPNILFFKEQSSPYKACGASVPGQQVVVNSWSRRIPLRDSAAHMSIDFLRILHQRVEEFIQSQLDLAKVLEDCNSDRALKPQKPPKAFTTKCRQVFHWIDPRQNPPPTEGSALAYEESLSAAIDSARQVLAMSSPEVNGKTLFLLNDDLNPHGYKAVPWQPLTPDEKTLMTGFMNKHFRNYYRTQLELTEIEFSKLYSRESDPSMEVQEKKLLENMNFERRSYLEKYRALIGAFPILNFISSHRPSPSEIASAAARLRRNGQKELNAIKKMGEQIQNTDKQIPESFYRLMGYNTIVEEVLAEHPEFCAVASSIHHAGQNSGFDPVEASAAPLFAATLLAPPMTAFAAGVAIGGTTVYSIGKTLIKKNSEIQGAFLAPTDSSRRSRANVDSVDEVNRKLKRQLIAVPAAAAGGALVRGKNWILPLVVKSSH